MELFNIPIIIGINIVFFGLILAFLEGKQITIRTRSTNPKLDFGIGQVVGVILLVALFYGSSIYEAESPEEFLFKFFSVGAGAMVLATFTAIIILLAVVPMLDTKKELRPSTTFAGLALSLGIIQMYVMLEDVTSFPFLENFAK